MHIRRPCGETRLLICFDQADRILGWSADKNLHDEAQSQSRPQRPQKSLEQEIIPYSHISSQTFDRLPTFRLYPPTKLIQRNRHG